MLPINREDCWSEECLVILVSYGLLVLVVRQALEALPLFCDPGRYSSFSTIPVGFYQLVWKLFWIKRILELCKNFWWEDGCRVDSMIWWKESLLVTYIGWAIFWGQKNAWRDETMVGFYICIETRGSLSVSYLEGEHSKSFLVEFFKGHSQYIPAWCLGLV